MPVPKELAVKRQIEGKGGYEEGEVNLSSQRRTRKGEEKSGMRMLALGRVDPKEAAEKKGSSRLDLEDEEEGRLLSGETVGRRAGGTLQKKVKKNNCRKKKQTTTEEETASLNLVHVERRRPFAKKKRLPR